MVDRETESKVVTRNPGITDGTVKVHVEAILRVTIQHTCLGWVGDENRNRRSRLEAAPTSSSSTLWERVPAAIVISPKSKEPIFISKTVTPAKVPGPLPGGGGGGGGGGGPKGLLNRAASWQGRCGPAFCCHRFQRRMVAPARAMPVLNLNTFLLFSTKLSVVRLSGRTLSSSV